MKPGFFHANVRSVGRALIESLFGLIRGLARPDALRSAFALVLLLVFAAATSLTQSHVHFTPAERAALALADTGAPVAVSAQKQLPADAPNRHDTSCTMCQTQAASGAYVATQSFVFDSPASAHAEISPEEQTLARGLPIAPWRSRAPPAV